MSRQNKQLCILTYALMLILSLSLASCGNNAPENKSKEADAKQTEEVQENDSIQEATLPPETFLITAQGIGLLRPKAQIAPIYTADPFAFSVEKRTEMQEGTKVDFEVDIITYNGDTIAEMIDGEKAVAFSPRFKTKEGIGIGSSAEKFIATYPDYILIYSYVGDFFGLTAPTLHGLFFHLPNDCYPADRAAISHSDMVSLRAEDIDTSSKIIKVVHLIY